MAWPPTTIRCANPLDTSTINNVSRCKARGRLLLVVYPRSMSFRYVINVKENICIRVYAIKEINVTQINNNMVLSVKIMFCVDFVILNIIAQQPII